VMHLMKGVTVEYHPQPEAGHNTAWWPQLKDIFEEFVAKHPRDPQPEKLTWETASLEHHRAHWLVIDQFGAQTGDAQSMSDLNQFTPSFRLFTRPKASGRVDLVRTGNTIQATTKGVVAYTLLLSPDKFDFDQPITVVNNGRTVFIGAVTRNLKTLMKW